MNLCGTLLLSLLTETRALAISTPEELKVPIIACQILILLDMKCVCMQYLEAIGRLKASVAKGKVAPPLRTLHLSFLPDEESGMTISLNPLTLCQVVSTEPSLLLNPIYGKR